LDLEPAQAPQPVWFVNGAWTCASTRQYNLPRPTSLFA
jgi:hypothetical protein